MVIKFGVIYYQEQYHDAILTYHVFHVPDSNVKKDNTCSYDD